MARRRVAAIAAGCLLLAGCNATVAGQGTADQGAMKYYLAEVAPLTSAVALGDITSVDYCSLLDGSLVNDSGDRPDPLGSFDFCLEPTKVNGQDVGVTVGYLFSRSNGDVPKLAPLPGKTLQRGLLAEQVAHPGSQDSCTYYLKFTDAITLQLDASLTNPGATGVARADLCALSSKVLDGAVTAITNHYVEHLDFSGMPLGKVDACALLPQDFVAGQLGVATKQVPTPSKHHCAWNFYGGPGDADLVFTVDLPAEGETGSSQETLGGRVSTVEPQPDKGCYVETVMGPDWSAGDDDGKQLAAIDVTDAAGKDPCAVARGLATEAWPKLPAAS